ncbi:hypothetical protein PF005_g19264 [Phytophthora fragariae]|uniref:Uncharacterized protein n=1 Tax=Phytophthora fragariae TaxID=53985 RepID=A0A6A3WZM8_9STRA|nr:hypothetical protein PF010_g18101 [Phytophthora fragariae]KAE9190421.1 hypothetical protein PF005_g19264 [Phytophthora fragariae]KAE9203805.1 hypothetical protein PF004_g18032 [Phytophthora fragariae]KAE9204765.1 hypothetical protein PF002_g20531 [Phytophthora fragariae]
MLLTVGTVVNFFRSSHEHTNSTRSGVGRARAFKYLTALQSNDRNPDFSECFIVDELHQLNEDLSGLFHSVGVTAPTDWDEQLEKNIAVPSVLTTYNAAVFHELQEPRAQVEAWLTLKFEMERRSDQHREESMGFMRSMLKTIAAVSTITLGPLPPWFLPATEVIVETKPFGRGLLGSVYHGVLGSTRVVQ